VAAVSVAAASAPRRRSLGARLWGAVVAAWAAVTGVAPHVLHHVGPLAGAALLAGFGGKAIFFVLGLVLSLPMLRRLLPALRQTGRAGARRRGVRRRLRRLERGHRAAANRD
jgi:hypothetical protein